MQNGYVIETQQANCHWQPSKKPQPSVGDAIHAIEKMRGIVRGRRLSGMYKARIIPAADKHWKREGKEPKIIKEFSL